jgi:carboxyl-terminal processing protease
LKGEGRGGGDRAPGVEAKANHRTHLGGLFVLLALLLAAPIAAARAEAPATAPASETPFATVFDEVWRLTDARFYDPHFNGHDWTAIGQRYRPLALASSSPADFSATVNRMLGELGASHTGYHTRSDQAYYDLADIFAGALRRELPRIFPDGRVSYVGIGATTRRIGGRIFVADILGGFPADRAGLVAGDEILAADGAPFDPIGSFVGKAGQRVTLAIRRAAGGPPQDIAVTPEELRPNDAYQRAIRASIRIIPSGGREIGYIRMWSYARRAYQRTLEEAISTGALKDADALVWDLRDGWGGAIPSYLDLFDRHGPTMTVTDRNGETSAVDPRWRKPVVLLINGFSRSGKEVLAYGFKKYHYGPVVGTRTKGDVLAATAFMLSDGSLLELPVEDVRVDGERLEGAGVTPTVEVPFTLEYSAGADPQLERAVEIAAQAANG